MPEPLSWSEPRPTGWATIEAHEDEHAVWRIVPVPRDVCRISYAGRDPDGTIVGGMDNVGYAESVEEAKILIDVIRAGTDHLPSWREQLEAAGFSRRYPDIAPGEALSGIWEDERRSGILQITVHDAYDRGDGDPETSVHTTYESGRANFWHNVSMISACRRPARPCGGAMLRDGLPHGVEALKAGVAAAIAIRAARQARGGRFADPIGGAPRERRAA